MRKGPYYAGVAACPMLIDRKPVGDGKSSPHHVNRMDDALKRRIRVSELGPVEKKALRNLLISHDEKMWENSSEELKQALAVDEEK